MNKSKLCLLSMLLCMSMPVTAEAATVKINEEVLEAYTNPSAPDKCEIIDVLLGGLINGDTVKVAKSDICSVTGTIPIKGVGEIVSNSVWYAGDFGIDKNKPDSKVQITEYRNSYEFKLSDGYICALRGSKEAYADLFYKIKNLCDNILCIKKDDDAADALTKVFDWLSENFAYDYNASNYTINKAFDNKGTQCWQIAKIFNIICDYLGVECDCVRSVDQTHMLNVVYLDNQKLYVDVTSGIGGYGHTYLLTPQYDLFGGPEI